MDQIEMLWICPNDSTKNLGRHKKCQTCGRHKTDKEEFIMPDDISINANITDESLLNKATLPEDLHCVFCGASRFADENICRECGASQVKVNIDISNTSQDNNVKVKNEGTFHVSRSRITEPVPDFRQKSHLLLILGTCVCLFSIGLYLLLRTSQERAKVSSVSWTYTVSIERYHAVYSEGWSTPFNAEDIHSLGTRTHHLVQVPNGTHSEWVTDASKCGQSCFTTPRICQPVPKTCSRVPRSCTSNKNGFASCTGGNTVCTGGGTSCTGGITSCSPKHCSIEVQDYRSEPVMQTWYSWNVWQWDWNRDVVTSGNSVETWWPSDEKLALRVSLLPREDERVVRKNEKYMTVFTSKSGRVLKYAPKSLAEFVSLNIGTEKMLNVSLIDVQLVK